MVMRTAKNLAVFYITAVLSLVLIFPGSVASQEEAASALRRYKSKEASSGYYEEYEVMPQRRRPIIKIHEVTRRGFPYTRTAAQVRIRTRLYDSHQRIKFYNDLRCEHCHADQARDVHTVRGNLTCRQCHGAEPISGIAHSYSPMNPIRRHAFVCAKCHEGSSVSFATYVVHEPAGGTLKAKYQFMSLYYADRFMFILLSGTLAFFVPHSFLVGLRELIAKMRKRK